jgi:hypothetical protein
MAADRLAGSMEEDEFDTAPSGKLLLQADQG